MSSAREIVSLVLAVIVVVVAAVAWQVTAYRQDVKAARKAEDELAREVEKVLAVRRNLERLRQEVEAGETEAERLSTHVPETLDVDARVEEIRSRWQRSGCRLCGVDETGQSDRNGLVTATVAVQVCCPPARLRSAASWGGACRAPGGNNLVAVSEAEIGVRSLRFQVTVPAWSGRAFEPTVSEPPALPAITTVLWPFTELSRRAQGDLRELHAEVVAGHPVFTEVAQLEVRRGQARQFVRTITELCRSQSADQEATEPMTIDDILADL